MSRALKHIPGVPKRTGGRRSHLPSLAGAIAHVDLAGQVLTFGREPVYVRATELPPQLADDPYLRVEVVDSAPPDVEVIELLKPERVQDPGVRCKSISPSPPATA